MWQPNDGCLPFDEWHLHDSWQPSSKHLQYGSINGVQQPNAKSITCTFQEPTWQDSLHITHYMHHHMARRLLAYNDPLQAGGTGMAVWQRPSLFKEIAGFYVYLM